MTTLCCLPHSSACVERIFSQVNNIKNRKTNLLKTETVTARILAKQNITKNGSNCTDWQPSKGLVKDLRSGETSALYLKHMRDIKQSVTQL